MCDDVGVTMFYYIFFWIKRFVRMIYGLEISKTIFDWYASS